MTALLLPALGGTVEGIIGNEGQITLNSLYDYLQSKMPSEQQPSLSGDFAGKSCVLASYPEKIAKLREMRSHSFVADRPQTTSLSHAIHYFNSDQANLIN